jgi:apolipoprotein D and lipocalin family protein
MSVRRIPAAFAVAVVVALGGMTATAAASRGSLAPVTPVPSVNIPQYLGKWFQIAAIPAVYELACAKDATANYTLAADGNLSVANDCTTRSGGVYQVTGEARPDNPPADSTLSVSFLDLFGVKFFAATPNYEVIGLDPGYAWAVVASPNHLSAFVLSRTPALAAEQISTTQAILRANGFDPCWLRSTVQDGGATAAVPYCPAAPGQTPALPDGPPAPSPGS